MSYHKSELVLLLQNYETRYPSMCPDAMLDLTLCPTNILTPVFSA
jgi:hypothetical protein